jgi:glycosyltransferase involved in cell wall biosynthesis
MPWFDARICEGLALRGHDTALVTFGGIDPKLLADPPATKVVDAARQPNQNHYLDALTESAKNPRLSPRQRFAMEMRTFRKAFSLLRAEPYDVMHIFEFHPITLLLAMRLFLTRRAANRTAFVAYLHHGGRLVFTGGYLRTVYAALYRRALAHLIRRRLQGLMVMDPSLKRDLGDYLNLADGSEERILLMPHGMDVEDETSTRHHPAPGPASSRGERGEARRRLNMVLDGPFLLFFGVLRRDKGLEVAIRAMKGLDSCRLLIFGTPFDWDPAEIRDFIRQQGCESCVSLEVGYCDDAEMRDYFLASDVVLVPYTKSFQGQSGILSRACTYGRCVIASDLPGIGETVKGHRIGVAVQPESVDSLRRAILEFLALKPQEREGMEARARALARQQSWDAVCSQLESHYYRILQSRALLS